MRASRWQRIVTSLGLLSGGLTLVAVLAAPQNASATSLSASPASLTFSGDYGTTRGQGVTITNTGTSSLGVDSVTVGASGAVPDVASGFGIDQDACSGATLAPSGSTGDTCTFDVTYTPVTGANQSTDVLVSTSGGVLEVPVNGRVHLPLYSDVNAGMNCANGGGFWRLDEAPDGGDGQNANDYSGCGNAGDYGNSTVYSASNPGPPGTYGDYGSYFDNAPSFVTTSTEVSNPETFTEGAWVYTTNSSYGQTVIGFGNDQTDPPGAGSYDRLLYIGTNGELYFVVYDGSKVTVNTTATLSNDTWYFVAATLSNGCASGQAMDVYLFSSSGSLLGSAGSTASDVCAQNYSGWWSIGASDTGSWPNIGSGAMYGDIMDAFVSGNALSESSLANMASDGGGADLAVPSVSGGGVGGIAFHASSSGVTGRMTFPATAVGSTSNPGGVTITEGGGASLSTGSVMIRGPDAADFTVTGDTCANTTVSVGGSCSIQVAFSPLGPGNFSAELTVADNTAVSATTVLLQGSTPNPYRSQVLSDISSMGLPAGDGAYLSLDRHQGNVAFDASGGGNDGFIQDDVGLAQPIAGSGAPACLSGDVAPVFDGGASSGQSYVQIDEGNLGTQPIGSTSNGSSSLSVAAWFDAAMWNGGNYRIVANDHPSSTSDGFDVYVNNGGGSVGFGMGFYGTFGGTHTTITATPSSALSLGSWYYVVATYSGSSSGSSMALYLYNSSGAEIASATGSQSSGSMYAGEYLPLIGRDPQYSGDYMDGSIAGVGIWYAPSTGTAELTSSEAQSLATTATSCATGVPDPSHVTFTNQPVGSTSSSSSAGGGPQVVLLANTGTTSLTVSSVSLAGADPQDFAVVVDHCSGLSVGPGGSCFMEVAFDPVSSGGLSAELVLRDTGFLGGAVVRLFGTTSNPYSSATSGEPPPSAQPYNEQGSWNLDQTSGTTVPDRSGSGNTGTYENSPTLGTAGSGSPVCTSNFTGATFNTGSTTDQYVDVPGLNDKVNYSALSVETWFELPSSGYTGGWTRLVSNGFPQGGTSYGGFELGIDPEPGTNGVGGTANGTSTGVFFNVRTSNGFQGPNNSGLSLSPGTWYDLVGVYNGSEVLVYLNGTLEASAPLTGSVMASPYDVLLAAGADEGGSGPGAPGSFFPGTISQVSIWSSALTPAQVSQHYGYFADAVATCAYWRLDEPPTSRTAYDTSPNATPTSFAGGAPHTPLADNGSLHGLVAPGQPITGTGAPICLPGDTADAFDGGYISTSRTFDNPQMFSVAAWFKTSTAGGGIVSFGNIEGGQHDRALYVGSNGYLYFGIWSTSANAAVFLSSAPTSSYSGQLVDNGEWYYAVGVVSSNGNMWLYLDGALIASNTTNTYTAQNYAGQWWIGFFGPGSGWPYEGALSFVGDIADVSVYDILLSRSGISPSVSQLYSDATSCGVASPSTSQLFFPNQAVASTSASQSVTVTNTGTATLTFPSSPATIGGSDPGDFELTGDTCAGASLSPGSTCSVSVAFDPTTTGGRAATLSLASNSAGGSIEVRLFGAVQVPYTAAVMSGEGAGSPAAYWRLDEPTGYTSAFDSSGNSNTATYQGDYTLGQSPSFMACDPNDTAVALDGASGRVTTPLVNYSPGGALTVEAWFRFVGYTGNPRVVANDHTDANDHGFELEVNNGGGSGFFVVGNGSSQGSATWTQSLSLNTWYFYVGTYNGSTVAAYIDGSLVASTSYSGGNVAPPATSGLPVAIGYDPAYNGDFVDGSVAQVAVYNSGLSSSEVAAQWSAATSCAEPSVTPSSLDFPNQPLFTTSASQTVTVANTATSGSPSLSVSSVSIEGTAANGAPDFAITADSCAGASVAPGASCTISVDFDPQFVGRTSAARQGTLVVTDTTESGAPATAQEVTLDGTVTDPLGIGVCSGGGTGAAGSTSCLPTETTGGVGAPLAYWRMDETSGSIAHDSSGNGHDGYLHGGVTLGNPGSVVSDTSETSMGFNGATSYISVPSLNDNVTPAALSVEGWFEPTGWTGNPRVVANSWTDGGCTVPAGACTTGFQLVVNSPGQSGQFAVGTQGGNLEQVTWSLSTPLALNTWYFYVGTYSSSAISVYLYQEGSSSPLVSASATPSCSSCAVAATPYDVEIGRDPVYQGDYFQGNIDQVAIYDSQLSSAEVATQFYAGESVFSVTMPSSLAWSTTLNGFNQSVVNGSSLTVDDQTQAGYGWDVEATSTQFSSSAHSLATNSLSVNGSSSSPGATTVPGVSCSAGTCGSTPSDTVGYPVTVPAGTGGSFPTPVSLFAAQYGTGQGSWSVGTDWWLSLPGNTYAGTYTSTIVVLLASGP